LLQAWALGCTSVTCRVLSAVFSVLRRPFRFGRDECGLRDES
jgi:hypothetical protein